MPPLRWRSIALACLLCIRRRSELSGDVAAFPWMRPVLRYGVGCMGGLALGMILYSVTFGLARSNDIRPTCRECCCAWC